MHSHDQFQNRFRRQTTLQKIVEEKTPEKLFHRAAIGPLSDSWKWLVCYMLPMYLGDVLFETCSAQKRAQSFRGHWLRRSRAATYSPRSIHRQWNKFQQGCFRQDQVKKTLYFIGFESDDIVNCLDVWFIKLEGNPPAEGKTKRHCMFAMIHQNVPINHWSMTSNQAVPRIQLDRVLPWALGATDPTPAVFFLAPLSGCRRSSAASMMRFSDSDPMFYFPEIYGNMLCITDLNGYNGRQLFKNMNW